MRKWMIVLGIVGMAAIGGTAIALAGGDDGSTRADRDTTTARAGTTSTLGVEPPGEPTDVQLFAEGECFFELDAVPCAEVHTQENFASFRITGAVPAEGDPETAPLMGAGMSERCGELFAQYTGITVLPDPQYSVGTMTIGLSSDGRLQEVTCLITGIRGNLDPLTGSARGAGSA